MKMFNLYFSPLVTRGEPAGEECTSVPKSFSGRTGPLALLPRRTALFLLAGGMAFFVVISPGRGEAADATAGGSSNRVARAAQTSDEQNLIVNGDFEDGVAPWTQNVMQGQYRLSVGPEDDKHESRVARIACVEESATGWARWYQTIPVETNRLYKLSVMVKTEGGAQGNVWLAQGASHLQGRVVSFRDTEETWRKIEIDEFRPIQEKIALYLESRGTGVVLFDHVVMTDITTDKNPSKN